MNTSNNNKQRVAVFVDVQNIYYTVMQMYNSHFDYTYFHSQVRAGRQVVKALAYAVSREDKSQLRFRDILKKIGFEVQLTPYLQRKDGTAKGNWDVGISLDILEYAKNADIIALASGDGDYTPVIEKVIRDYGVDVEVYGVPGLTASSLIKSAGRFIPIDRNFLLPIPVKW